MLNIRDCVTQFSSQPMPNVTQEDTQSWDVKRQEGQYLPGGQRLQTSQGQWTGLTLPPPWTGTPSG